MDVNYISCFIQSSFKEDCLQTKQLGETFIKLENEKVLLHLKKQNEKIFLINKMQVSLKFMK